MKPVVGPNGWQPGRGDYGTDNATELVDLIEERCCSLGQGCERAGTDDDINEFGPSGTCGIIGRIYLRAEAGIPEVNPRPDGPVCASRVERRLPVPQPDSLFEMGGDGGG